MVRRKSVAGDSERIRQIVWNLVSNAIHSLPTEDRSVKLERVGKYVEIMVSDTGVGIVPDFPAARLRPFPPGRRIDHAGREG